MDKEDFIVESWPPREGMTVGSPFGVRVIHISGIMATVNCDRSQRINREIAINMIESALTHPKFNP